MVTYPTITKLLDTFIVEFNGKIVNDLTWLNNPLGKIEELSKHLDGKYIKAPSMHTDSGEYMEVLPDDTLVNYSWFNFAPIQITGKRILAKLKASCDWNLYLNVEDVTGTSDARAIENVKYDVIQALTNISLLNASIVNVQISESFKDVYKGFSISNTDDRYFMQPFAGLSVKMDVYLRNNVCNLS